MSCYNVLGTFKFLKSLLGEEVEVEESVWIRCITRFFDRHINIGFKKLMRLLGHKNKTKLWENIETQAFYILWLCHRSKFSNLEDLYQLKIRYIRQYEGYGLLAMYNYSVYEIVKSIYPYHKWIPWKFSKVGANFWNLSKNQRWYADWLYDHLGFNTMEDWYKVIGDTFIQNNGLGLLQIYNGSATLLLLSIYPDYKWLVWKFVYVPTGYWDNKDNRKVYTEWLKINLNIKTMEDWYNVTEDDFIRYEGLSVIRYYHHGIKDLVKDLYPEYEWFPWKFKLVPHRFWDDILNQKWYIRWLFKELNYTSIEDWYQIMVTDFLNNYGSSLITIYYNSSPFKVLKTLIEYDWLEWRMVQAPSGFWLDKDNRRKYMIWLTSTLGYTSYNEWYKLSSRLFEQNYGQTLIGNYSDSIYNMLIDTFDEIKWIRSKFNMNRYSKISIEWLKSIESLYNITIEHEENVGEYKIINSRYRADGYHRESNTIYEFNGCMFHGCPKCYPIRTDIDHLTKRTYQDSYDKTIKKREFILESGYNLVEIWECEYKQKYK
jgi:hypothetical protein